MNQISCPGDRDIEMLPSPFVSVEDSFVVFGVSTKPNQPKYLYRLNMNENNFSAGSVEKVEVSGLEELY